MAFLPPAIIEIKALADKAIAEFGQVNKELEKIEGSADKAGKGVDKMSQVSRIATAGLLAAGTALAGFAAYGVKAAMEMETELTKLGSSLANIGLNTDSVRGQMMETIDSMEGLGFAGEDAAAALTTLIQRTGDAEQSQKLLALSSDVARAKGMSLTQASTLLAQGAMGNARAFRQFGITLDETLPKNQAIAKAFDELQQKVGGQAQAATQTLGVQMQILHNEFENVAETVGATLIPIFTDLVKKFRAALDWAKQNKDMLIKVGTAVTVVAVALAAYNATVKIITITQNLWNKATLFGKSVLALFTKQQQAANTAMKANPIGLVVTAVMLLAAGFVYLWNKSEMFRKIAIEVGKAGVKAIGFIIDIVGKLATGLIKIQTGPLKLLLKGLSLLGVDAAKDALNGIEKMTDGIGNFFDSAAKKVTSMAGELDKLKDKKIKIGLDFKAPKIPKIEGLGGDGDAGIKGLAKDKSEAAKKKEEIKKNNKKYREMIAGYQKEIAQAVSNYQEDTAKAEKTYQERVAKIQADGAKKRLEIEKNRNEKTAEANKRAEEASAKLLKNYNDKKTQIHQRYNETVGNLNKKYANDLAKIKEDNVKKIASIEQSGAEKLKSIIQDSMNRLRDAFKSGTSFSLGDLFKGLVEAGTKSGNDLLDVLKQKLTAAQKLAANASALAGMGFSQTFIEQVVSAGPEIGNELADAIKSSDAGTIAQLQSTYSQLEEITNKGMDALASTIYDKNGLANAELVNAYKQTQEEMAAALEDQRVAYGEAMDNINAEYAESLAAAALERTEALIEAQKDYEEANAEIAKELQESLASIQKDYEESIAELDLALKEALAEAQKDFEESMAEAKKKLDEALTAIKDKFVAEFSKIEDATWKTKAAVDALIASLQMAAALGSGGGGGGGYSTTSSATTSSTTSSSTTSNNSTVSVTISGTNLTSPQDTANAVVNSIKYGNAIATSPSSLASKESGAIGAASVRAQQKLDPTYISMRAR